MNPQASWRDSAITHIAPALIEYAELHPGDIIDPKACRKWISANRYPFGQRKYLPYRIWCEESRKILSFFEAHSDPRAYPGWRNGFSRTAKSAKAQAKAAESIGQINMFDILRTPSN
jgi:hypothetical protein